MFEDIYNSVGNVATNTWESVSEGASNWVDAWINKQVSEVNAQPETNEQKGKNVTFGDGKESPTVTTTQPTAKPQLIAGVENSVLLLGVVGLVAVIAVVKE